MAQYWTPRTGLATNAGIERRGDPSRLHLLEIGRELANRYFGEFAIFVDQAAKHLLFRRMKVYHRSFFNLKVFKKFLNYELPRAVSSMNSQIQFEQHMSRIEPRQREERRYEAVERSYVFLLQKLLEDYSFNPSRSFCIRAIAEYHRVLRDSV